MAKLNGVKTLDMANGEIMKVEYNGEVYARVGTKDGRPGDLGLRIKDNRNFAKVGEFYPITANEDGPLRFSDDVGATPYVAEGLEKFVYFRKVNEPLSVGDTVKLTIAEGNRPKFGWGGVSNGDVGKVVAVYEHKVVVDFPAQDQWGAAPSELTKVMVESAPVQSDEAYALVTDREPKAGDFVKFAEDGFDDDYDLTVGKYYEIIEIDACADAIILDDDGDEHDTSGDDFEVYEKAVVESNGWKKGDKVRHKRSGRVVEVFAYQPEKRTQGFDAGMTFMGQLKGFTYLTESGREQWEHIDNYELITEETRHAEQITHNGATYTIVDRKAQPGDVVYVTKDAEGTDEIPTDANYLVDANGKIESKSGYSYDVYPRSYNRTPANVKVYEPQVASVAAEKPLSVGDYAKVVVAGTIYNVYGIAKGEIVEIIKVDESETPYQMKSLLNGEIRWAKTSHIVRATDEEVTKAKAELEFASINEGDYVKIIDETGGHGFKIGEIVKIKHKSSYDFTAEYLDGSDYWYVGADEIEKASEEEEVAQIRAKQAEHVRWAAIGRKPNEFKKGDIVITTEDDIYSEGTIAEVGDVDHPKASFRIIANGKQFGNWTGSYGVKLITPVEARFDRQ